MVFRSFTYRRRLVSYYWSWADKCSLAPLSLHTNRPSPGQYDDVWIVRLIWFRSTTNTYAFRVHPIFVLFLTPSLQTRCVLTRQWVNCSICHFSQEHDVLPVHLSSHLCISLVIFTLRVLRCGIEWRSLPFDAMTESPFPSHYRRLVHRVDIWVTASHSWSELISQRSMANKAKDSLSLKVTMAVYRSNIENKWALALFPVEIHLFSFSIVLTRVLFADWNSSRGEQCNQLFFFTAGM